MEGYARVENMLRDVIKKNRNLFSPCPCFPFPRWTVSIHENWFITFLTKDSRDCKFCL